AALPISFTCERRYHVDKAATFNYDIRHTSLDEIPAIRAMQERSMWVLGSDFYTPGAIANFLGRFGTMDDSVVEEGHFFVAVDGRGAILGSGGWTHSRPKYQATVGEPFAEVATVRSVFVDPAATRRGIASAVMARTERGQMRLQS